MYTNMAAVTKFIAKNNKTTTSASKTTSHFGYLMHTSFVYTFKELNYRRIPLDIRIWIPKSNIPLDRWQKIFHDRVRSFLRFLFLSYFL